MPRYVYFNCECTNEEGTFERMSMIEDRDAQKCDGCREALRRKINVFSGSVWSPTKNGGMS